jgi:hypothetical protein
MTHLRTDVAESFEHIYPVLLITEDWEDVLERAGERRRSPGSGILRPLRRGPGRAVLACAALAFAAVAALFVSAPWSSSTAFLERAQAALTPPPDSVLHVKWDATRTSVDYGCTVTARANEMWVDQAPPYRYRVLDRDAPPEEIVDTRTESCAAGRRPIEFGGTLQPPQSLRFEPPNTLRRRSFGFGGPPDFVAALRQAIADGTAHHDGRTELDGRTVERIRMAPAPCPDTFRSLKPPCPPPEPSFAYMDPETFRPVRIDFPYGIARVVGDRVLRFHIVHSYRMYEYLPRTDAHVALADIKEQHPDASVRAEERRRPR